ncbi:hypothetical protein [Novipirellula artificiosorum]|uniref:hypothetical protein n=1 Tax=Novipirellula artificiosorum TaxID=2528016 RepID=UPI0011B63939|nr:hypothetical protein [Novipirellula artificiosorum]
MSNCVIVGPPSLNDLQRIAIDDFRQTIRQTSGADIALVSAEDAASLPEATVRILLNPDSAAGERSWTMPSRRPTTNGLGCEFNSCVTG